MRLGTSQAGAEAVSPRHGWLGGWFATTLIVLGAIVLQAGVVAGYVNRQVLDVDRFAVSVDEVRRQPAVSAALGRTLTDRLLQSQPDAVAMRPLIDSVAASVVGSEALSGPTRVAAAQFQRSLTEPEGDVLVLRIADAAAVLTAALVRIAPRDVVSPDTTVPLVLARIGNQSFAGQTLGLARFVRTMAWLLPLAGVALMLLGVLMARRRRRAVFTAGLAVVAGSCVLAMALLAGGWWADGQDDQTVSGALVRHGWPVLMDSAWWSVLAGGVVGVLVAASAASLLPELNPVDVVLRGWRLAARRPRRPAAQVLRAVALLAIGVAVALRPLGVAVLAGVLLGVWLVLYGAHELSAATTDEDLRLRRRRPVGAQTLERASPMPRRATRASAVAAVVALALLIGLVTWGGDSSPATAAAGGTESGAIAGTGAICNGYAALCDRRFNDVALAGTHNAMATASDRSWFIPEQGPSIPGQLDDGVRALLIDVWPGFPTVDGRVATARSAWADAKAELERDVGVETVAAGLRLLEAVQEATPAGPEGLYLCHGLCELGSADVEGSMALVKAWLDAHPDEVITIGIEDHVAAADIGAALDASGLDAYAATPPAPVSSGRRCGS